MRRGARRNVLIALLLFLVFTVDDVNPNEQLPIEDASTEQLIKHEHRLHKDNAYMIMMDVYPTSVEKARFENQLHKEYYEAQKELIENNKLTASAEAELQKIYHKGSKRHLQLRYFKNMFGEDRTKIVHMDPHCPRDNPTVTDHAKFIRIVNLSNETFYLAWWKPARWQCKERRGEFKVERFTLGSAKPMTSISVLSFVGDRIMAISSKTSQLIADWIVEPQWSFYVHDVSMVEYETWSDEWTDIYDLWHDTLSVAPLYYRWTGRPLLSNGHRALPKHYMHTADYVGQELHAPTKHLSGTDYNFTPVVISTGPRILQWIPVIFTDEREMILEGHEFDDYRWRNSSVTKGNRTYGNRHKLDNYSFLYQIQYFDNHHNEYLTILTYRLADLMKIPIDVFEASVEPYALSHFMEGQKFGREYGFVAPPMSSESQATLYATIFIWMNDDFDGGSIHFPRTNFYLYPQAGKAFIVYHMLPDGNMDDYSVYEHEIVTYGEKYLLTARVWDPHLPTEEEENLMP